VIADGERLRDQHRAKLPVSEGGVPFCPACGYTLEPEDWGCKPCGKRQREAEQREAAVRKVQQFWRQCARPTEDGLGELPDWPECRFQHARWRAECDDRVIRFFEQHFDGTASAFVAAGTGAGKTSATIAWLERERERAIAATKGELLFFAYVPGHELGEAAKRRKLGRDEHDLVQRAYRCALLILDEAHAAPTDVLMAITDKRYRAKLPTIAMCGVSAADFGRMHGAAVLRRLLQGKRLDLYELAQKAKR
jgi:hypothetical protein